MVEMVSVLAVLLRNFRFELDESKPQCVGLTIAYGPREMNVRVTKKVKG
jgi:hypothetical protein